MWLRISLCDVLHSASRVHVVYSCVFVYEYSRESESDSLMLDSES